MLVLNWRRLSGSERTGGPEDRGPCLAFHRDYGSLSTHADAGRPEVAEVRERLAALDG